MVTAIWLCRRIAARPRPRPGIRPPTAGRGISGDHEHRAAHLVDAARAYLLTGDPVHAGRVLVDAERTAPAEIRHRLAAREVLAQVTRDRRAPAAIIQLANTLGVA
ncbi:hypothetical protein V6U90_32315 [Micromonospora sp. CPCC 206060]|uniref:hypothetical protein n=1 Tax=Micromonospora sp. CPCC 206060 TaxID=3122406 RepID=UPI002FF00A05